MPLTDEESALKAISTLEPLSEAQRQAKDEIDRILSSDDPIVNIHELFGLYNILYFRSLLLPGVEVSWSARLTLCAGICELVRDPSNGNKYTRVRLKLSQPLLKFRSRGDVINTLLHEAIHAYFFVTTSWRHLRGDDVGGHGAGFLLLADAINYHGSYQVSVFHSFLDEVDSYRTHVWQCNGPCQSHPPFFGLVKRSMNRAPGKSDHWWSEHSQECGGSFTKIKGPELTKDQVEKMSGLKRAGLQKNKIDTYVRRQHQAGSSRRQQTGTGTANSKRARERSASPMPGGHDERQCAKVLCPICNCAVFASQINDHLDRMHDP